MAAADGDDDDGDTSNLQVTLGIIKGAYLFKIPPKASAMGHMAESWPKKAMWGGRLKVLSTATECTLQFEDVETDKVYLSVLINNDKDKVATVEPAFDSSRYFALNMVKPGTSQMFELGLGFQSRDESMDFKMSLGEFERMKANAEEAKQLDLKPTEDFSLGDDGVLVMKPMAKKKKKSEEKESTEGDDGGGGLFLPPPSDEGKGKGKGKKKSKKAKKKKKKKTEQEEKAEAADDAFGDFGDFADPQGAAAADGDWA